MHRNPFTERKKKLVNHEHIRKPYGHNFSGKQRSVYIRHDRDEFMETIPLSRSKIIDYTLYHLEIQTRGKSGDELAAIIEEFYDGLRSEET